MKAGRLFTALQLMAKVAKARAGEEPKTDGKGNYLEDLTLGQLEEMVRSGQWRHRGKGRGGIIHNHLGKRRPPKYLPHQGKREIERRWQRAALVFQTPEAEDGSDDAMNTRFYPSLEGEAA